MGWDRLCGDRSDDEVPVRLGGGGASLGKFPGLALSSGRGRKPASSARPECPQSGLSPGRGPLEAPGSDRLDAHSRQRVHLAGTGGPSARCPRGHEGPAPEELDAGCVSEGHFVVEGQVGQRQPCRAQWMGWGNLVGPPGYPGAAERGPQLASRRKAEQGFLWAGVGTGCGMGDAPTLCFRTEPFFSYLELSPSLRPALRGELAGPPWGTWAAHRAGRVGGAAELLAAQMQEGPPRRGSSAS